MKIYSLYVSTSVLKKLLQLFQLLKFFQIPNQLVFRHIIFKIIYTKVNL